MRLIDADKLKETFEKTVVISPMPYAFVKQTIDNAPMVEVPEGKWIPVSERLPNRNGVYNVTRIIEGTRLTDACYFDGQNTWHEDICVNHGRPYLIDVIAWQPLPEPYKKGEEE